ncbi:hypothetical protein KST80_09625 [Fusobacterium polymorphum]|uniref:Uncharacterized protein n=1 Tax=Fusobacterium nucleatum subsp. polymorphum TaxID=76857 RepID=A0A2C6C5W3_FUSNP|nr:hypothetical protein [Fusobacterium polymorphum]PHH99595.1 hypothetical protein CA836_07905 [Fusobacterium polymorphum]PHI06850.1 hypothetical protein CBG54_07260 [Fusobacterium polymorphum]PHI13328.1 hypothetical protein CBG59_06290 [Fusobacterium polymorphum]PHI16439.1 hypothetical protein CBG58_05150 [Fusobacterium polymorphum]PIM75580.1 hypothetical protein CTM65_06030 [Fusobacterium polymorphum]
MKKVLITLTIFFLIFFLNMCIRYIPENHYILVSDNQASEEEKNIYKSLSLKSIRLSEEQSLLFEFYDDLKNDLDLIKVEIFYEHKIIGIININKKISSLENSWKVDKITSKECKLKEDFSKIMGKDYKKYDITYPNRNFELIIYLKNLNTKEIFKIKKNFSLYFRKKGFEFFILSA